MKIEKDCRVASCSGVKCLKYQGPKDWDSDIGKFLQNVMKYWEGLLGDYQGVMYAIIPDDDLPENIPAEIKVEDYAVENCHTIAYETVGEVSGWVVSCGSKVLLFIKKIS
jgi:hypothetical protein